MQRCLSVFDAPVKECVQNLGQEDDKENLVASLWGAERCLRVLESVSLRSLAKVLRKCSKTTCHFWLSRDSRGKKKLLLKVSSPLLFSDLCALQLSALIDSAPLSSGPPPQVTVQNPENQGYLIAYKDSQLIVSSAR